MISRLNELDEEMFHAQLKYNSRAVANIGPMQALIASAGDEENAGTSNERHAIDFMFSFILFIY